MDFIPKCYHPVMVGVLLITHEKLGDALVSCAAHVLGKTPEQTATLAVPATMDPSDLLPQARALVRTLDTGDGVLILTDVFGASPSNLACKLIEPNHIEAVSGANVPMILRALNYRTQGMSALLKRVVGGGCEGVFRIESSATGGSKISETLAGQLKQT
jgi:mannose PTS system EIIA component